MPSLNATEPSLSRESRLAQAVDEFLARRAAGDTPSIDSFVTRYSDLAAELPDVLGMLDVLTGMDDDANSSDGAVARLRTLGDYRLIREIGRGGMGIVYEAEQLSLARRVALKILPFAAVLDPRHLQRFKNEALAAAHLDHPNIVEVYGVGCERGVHFYAMRYIEGQTLADVIEGMRKDECGRGNDSVGNGHSLPAVAGAVPEPPTDVNSADSPLPIRHSPLADTAAIAALSTLRTTRPKDYYRRIAELGIQAAEALDHAHQMGIVHRDIKPSNIMLDERGKLWITDFGLARVESDVSMTMTGDLLGTLRYMSPEQALAKRVTVDHRTDIYSLGVTLYELLTFRPPYTGEDRQELLRQIAFQEPLSLRRINPAVPVDLETIVLKAMAKNPDERYTTAREFVDDLRRLIDDKPIRARRPTLVDRTLRFARRRIRIVVAGLVCLALLAAASSLAAVLFARQQSATQTTNNQLRAVVQHLLPDINKPENAAHFESTIAAIKGILQTCTPSESEHYRLILANTYVGYANVLGATRQSDAAYRAGLEALNISQSLVADFPQNANYQFNLALIYRNLGNGRFYEACDYAKASDDWSRCIEIGKDLHGRDFAKWDIFRAAALSLIRLLAICPDEKFRDPNRALHLAEELIQAQPEDVTNQRFLAFALYGVGRYEDCIAKLLDVWPKISPSDEYDAAAVLAMAYAKSGNPVHAHAWYHVLVEWNQKYPLSPDHVWQFAHYATQMQRQVESLLGVTQETLDKALLAAIERYHGLAENEPANPEHRFRLGVAWKNWSTWLGAHQRYVESVEALQESIENYEQVVGGSSKTLEHEITLAGTYKTLGGRYCHDLRQYGEAIAAWQKSVDAFEQITAQHGINATAALNFRQSVIFLSLLLSTCPDKALRDPSKSLALANRYAELDPNRFDGDLLKGAALLAADRNKEAIEALLRVPHQSTFGPHRGLLLSAAYAQAGRMNEAVENYRRAADQFRTFKHFQARNDFRENFDRMQLLADSALKAAGAAVPEN